jgi:hypothetical protein
MTASTVESHIQSEEWKIALPKTLPVETVSGGTAKVTLWSQMQHATTVSAMMKPRMATSTTRQKEWLPE